MEDILTVRIWNDITYRLSYTANTMLADALLTLAAGASVGMVLTPSSGWFRLQH